MRTRAKNREATPRKKPRGSPLELALLISTIERAFIGKVIHNFLESVHLNSDYFAKILVLLLQRNQPLTQPQANGVGTTDRSEFGRDRGEMKLYGMFADLQLASNKLVR